jgi:hypothetical protein
LSPPEFTDILFLVPPKEQESFLIETQKKYIKNYRFDMGWGFVSEENRQKFLAILAESIHVNNFTSIWYWIPGGKTASVWETIEAKITAGINANNFYSIFYHIPFKARLSFFKKIEDQIVLSVSADNFTRIFPSVPKEAQESFWEQVEDQIATKIPTDKFKLIFPLVPKDKQEGFWVKCKQHLASELCKKTEIEEYKQILPSDKINYLSEEYARKDHQNYLQFQQSYTKQIGFFTNPLSRHWKSDEKDGMDKVEKYVKEHPKSRTASIYHGMRK